MLESSNQCFSFQFQTLFFFLQFLFHSTSHSSDYNISFSKNTDEKETGQFRLLIKDRIKARRYTLSAHILLFDKQFLIYVLENPDSNKRTKRETALLFSDISKLLENDEFVRFVEAKVNKSLEKYISSISFKRFCKETRNGCGEIKGMSQQILRQIALNKIQQNLPFSNFNSQMPND